LAKTFVVPYGIRLQGLFERVKLTVCKAEQALIQDDFLSFFTGSIQDEAGPIASRNGYGHVDQVSLSKVDPHIDRDGFGFFCCSGLRRQKSSGHDFGPVVAQASSNMRQCALATAWLGCIGSPHG
jgi:hypothetical protein